MKRFIALALSLVLCFGLIGCGSKPAASATPKDYAQIIHDSRPAEFSEAFMTVSPNKEGESFVAVDGFAAEYTEPGQLDSFANDMVLPLLGLKQMVEHADGSIEYKDFDPAIYTDFSASVSLMMTQCYGVAIVKPAEGQTEAVKAALETFIENQKMAFEFYLADQFEVAEAATVTVADSGEVVLVCCQDSETVKAAILEALKG